MNIYVSTCMCRYRGLILLVLVTVEQIISFICTWVCVRVDEKQRAEICTLLGGVHVL